MRWHGEAVKILEVGSLALFGALSAYTWLAAPEWTVATVRLAVDAGLLAIVLVSLAIDRPFTLQYARERVPEAFWAMPLFLTTNRIISAAWASGQGPGTPTGMDRSRDLPGASASLEPRLHQPAAFLEPSRHALRRLVRAVLLDGRL